MEAAKLIANSLGLGVGLRFAGGILPFSYGQGK
jgi:hypothetical protein